MWSKISTDSWNNIFHFCEIEEFVSIRLTCLSLNKISDPKTGKVMNKYWKNMVKQKCDDNSEDMKEYLKQFKEKMKEELDKQYARYDKIDVNSDDFSRQMAQLDKNEKNIEYKISDDYIPWYLIYYKMCNDFPIYKNNNNNNNSVMLDIEDIRFDTSKDEYKILKKLCGEDNLLGLKKHLYDEYGEYVINKINCYYYNNVIDSILPKLSNIKWDIKKKRFNKTWQEHTLLTMTLDGYSYHVKIATFLLNNKNINVSIQCNRSYYAYQGMNPDGHKTALSICIGQCIYNYSSDNQLNILKLLLSHPNMTQYSINRTIKYDDSGYVLKRLMDIKMENLDVLKLLILAGLRFEFLQQILDKNNEICDLLLEDQEIANYFEQNKKNVFRL